MTVTNFGARVITLKVPDHHGRIDDIILGHNNPEDYINGPYFGALIGRYANRISNARLTLDGKTYQLPINHGANHLHGGTGFQNRFWKATPGKIDGEQALLLEYTSPDNENGIPASSMSELHSS